MNCFAGIILSVKTRSEQQVSKLKQANVKLAMRVEQLENSCMEKVRNHFQLNQIYSDPFARLSLSPWFLHQKAVG